MRHTLSYLVPVFFLIYLLAELVVGAFQALCPSFVVRLMSVGIICPVMVIPLARAIGMDWSVLDAFVERQIQLLRDRYSDKE